jgi:universal stress protein A
MKVKPSKAPGNVVLELGPEDERILSKNAAGSGSAALFKLKKILVPVDFSDCSRKALQYAIPFAKQFGASITLLHVVQINFVGGEFGSIDYPLLENELKEGRAKLLDRLLQEEIRNDIPADASMRIGQPLSEIIKAAKELEIDLIIISTHGHTGLKHVFLGSTAESVVRYAPCPVLTVREHEHEFVQALASSSTTATIA